MSHIINNKETNKGDQATYVDYKGAMHEAVIKDINIRHGYHYADLEVSIDGKPALVDAPHCASPMSHSWNHVAIPVQV